MTPSVEIIKLSASAAYLADKTVAEPIFQQLEKVPGILAYVSSWDHLWSYS